MEDMFANLPEELVSDILRRLSIRSVMTCKCVCRSWRRLIKGDEFASSYTSKPGLSFVHRDGREYTVLDGAFKPLFRFGFPEGWNFHVVIASVNGLLAVWDHDKYAIQMFVCNPMTREYATLPPLMGTGFFFGFGVSKLSGLYKILCSDQYGSCHVYTLGRGRSGREWRSIASTAPGVPTLGGDCAKFLNGNLHWLVSNIEKNDLVCSFDIETELFTSFSPPHDYGGNPYGNNHLYILEGQLCLCDILNSNHVVIWKINSYGDENSWIKEYTFLLHVSPPYFDFYHGIAYKFKVLANDGDWLFATNGSFVFVAVKRLFINSKNTEANTKPLTSSCSSVIASYFTSNVAIYSPSLLSLRTIGLRNVRSLSFN